MIKNGIINSNPKIKFKKFEITIDRGITSLGTINWFINEALSIMELVASERLEERKIQGMMAHNTNKGKNLIFIGHITEKTKVMASIIKTGVRMLHQSPRKEPIYLAFKF